MLPPDKSMFKVRSKVVNCEVSENLEVRSGNHCRPREMYTVLA